MDTHHSKPQKSIASPNPEFAPLPRIGACPYSGLSRSTIYNLEKQGLIRLVRVRRPGQVFGRVLIDLESVRNYYRQLIKQQAKERVTLLQDTAQESKVSGNTDETHAGGGTL